MNLIQFQAPDITHATVMIAYPDMKTGIAFIAFLVRALTGAYKFTHSYLCEDRT